MLRTLSTIASLTFLVSLTIVGIAALERGVERQVQHHLAPRLLQIEECTARALAIAIFPIAILLHLASARAQARRCRPN